MAEEYVARAQELEELDAWTRSIARWHGVLCEHNALTLEIDQAYRNEFTEVLESAAQLAKSVPQSA